KKFNNKKLTSFIQPRNLSHFMNFSLQFFMLNIEENIPRSSMKKALFTFLLFASFNAFSLPSEHLDLLPYLQPAPDQGETNTCLFVSSTGAVELLLNQK